MNNLTPCYVFSAERFAERINLISESLPGVRLVYSMKANPFLLYCLPDRIDMVEVCSPGELSICEKLSIPGKKILYSGVVKGKEDILRALRLGAGYLTAESRGQFKLLKEAVEESGREASVLLRISSGNQFGMSREDFLTILGEADKASRVKIEGIHLFSGTSKRRIKAIEKDLELIRDNLREARERFGFEPKIIEYGPGLGVNYFEKNLEASENAERATLAEASKYLNEFAKEYPLSIEMGRFMAAPSGYYESHVVDLKTTDGVNYALLDGGMHHLNYYGQNMAMKIPVIEQSSKEKNADIKTYCLCGSLCTTADVIVREVELNELHTGDCLRFERTGAYSVTEAPALFLSRDLPEVCIERDGKKELVRGHVHSFEVNC